MDRNGLVTNGIRVINYMRTTFIRALAVTICAILAINYFARIDAYRARIVDVFPRIVIIFSRTVSQNRRTPKFTGHLSL